MPRLFVTALVSACLLASAGLTQTATIPIEAPATSSPADVGNPSTAVPRATGAVNLRTCPKAKASSCRGNVLHRRGR